jgi:hypothetical protein
MVKRVVASLVTNTITYKTLAHFIVSGSSLCALGSQHESYIYPRQVRGDLFHLYAREENVARCGHSILFDGQRKKGLSTEDDTLENREDVMRTATIYM